MEATLRRGSGATQNTGKAGHLELRRECVCDDILWIWHLKFGFPGAMNDLNILDCTPFFSDVRAGVRTPFKPEFTVAGRVIDWFYWVVDGIYPSFRIFLNTISNPQTKREKKFAKEQEAFRKGVERVYAALFSRWHILSNQSRIWHTEDMDFVVRTCAILHNMIVKERDRDGNMGTNNIVNIDPEAEVTPLRTNTAPSATYEAAELFRQHADGIGKKGDNEMLNNALVYAIWEGYGKGSSDEVLHSYCNRDETD